mmetsp:Transcript_21274/g.31304  ORF Transcript_21274/g.31304 Transcript_21274/m.31304 type:complete len:106 (-) Transcript_21274:400-717(-)
MIRTTSILELYYAGKYPLQRLHDEHIVPKVIQLSQCYNGVSDNALADGVMMIHTSYQETGHYLAGDRNNWQRSSFVLPKQVRNHEEKKLSCVLNEIRPHLPSKMV